MSETVENSALQAQVRYSRLAAASRPPVISDLMQRALTNPDLLSLAAGFTDNALLPVNLIAEAVQALAQTSVSTEWLQYGTCAGRPGLRTAALKWLRQQPGETLAERTADDVLIANGSQQALYLAVQTLCDPGDIFLVESPSYFVFLELISGLGVRAISLPATPDGSIDRQRTRDLLHRLKADGEKKRIKGLYLQGYFANPTGSCLTLDSKLELARLLADMELSLPVLEDGAYRDLYFETPYPIPSVLSLEPWEAFPRLYLGTFTKPLATGLKVGFAVSSDAEWLQKLCNTKGHQDFGTANANQAIVEHLLENDRYTSLLESTRPRYAAKAQRLMNALKAGGLLELGWRWHAPKGGLLLWLEGPSGLATGPDSDFCAACLEAGVMYVPGSLCFADGQPDNCVRLSFGAIEANRIEEAAQRFCAVAARFSAR